MPTPVDLPTDPDLGSETAPPPAVPGANLLLPRGRSARRWLIAASLVVHLGAIGTYVVLGMWRVERVAIERRPLEVVAARMIDPGGGGEQKPGRKPPPVKPPAEKQQVRRIVQPVTQAQVSPEQTPSTATAASEPGDGNDTPGGGGGGDPLKPPGGGGGCVGPDCKEDEPAPPKPQPPKKVTFVPPTTVEQLRTRGNTQIHPSEITKTTMLHQGRHRTVATVKFCIDERGSVHGVTLMKSSGHDEYDQKLLAGVRGWGYRPYQVGGAAVPVCTAVTFSYVMK